MGALRACYETDCRFYEGGPVGRIRYYFVPATNRVYLGPNKFFGWSQVRQCRQVEGTGEITINTRKFFLGTNRYPDRDGSHVEGTITDFAGESPWAGPYAPTDCDNPPGIHLRIRLRMAQWGPRILRPRGGLVLDGVAGLRYDRALLFEGGLLLDGDAGLIYNRDLAAEGGLLLDGAAGIAYGRELAGNGGLLFDGIAVIAYVRSLAVSGGLLLDGSAALTYARSLVGGGGLLLDGDAGITYARSLAGGGGLLLDGAAGITYGAPLVAAGGLLLDGAAGITYQRSLMAGGGLRLDGGATITSHGTLWYLRYSLAGFCNSSGYAWILQTAPPAETMLVSVNSGSFTEVATFSVNDINNHTGDWFPHLNITALDANTEVRYRMQAVENVGCTVTASSPYSTVYSTTGAKSDVLPLAWGGGANRPRLSVEMRRSSGSGVKNMTITLGGSSWTQRIT